MKAIVWFALLCSLFAFVGATEGQTTYFHDDGEGACSNSSCPPWGGATSTTHCVQSRTTAQSISGASSHQFSLTTVTSSGNRCFRVLFPGGNQLPIVPPAFAEDGDTIQGAYWSWWTRLASGWTQSDLTVWKFLMDMKTVNETGECEGGPKWNLQAVGNDTNRQLKLEVSYCEAVDGNGDFLLPTPNFDGPTYNSVAADRPCDLKRDNPIFFPDDQWVHIEVFGKFAKQNGHITVWQTIQGQSPQLVFDLTHQNLDTLTRQCKTTSGRTTNERLYWGFGPYIAPSGQTSEPHTVIFDEVKITSFPTRPETGGGDTTPPDPPTNLQLTSPYPGHMQVSWSAPTGSGEQIDVTGYNLDRCQGIGCSGVDFFPVPGYSSGTSFLDTGLQPGESYTYRVRAFDEVPNFGSFITLTEDTLAGGLVAHWNLDQGSDTTATDVEDTGTDHDGQLCNGATCPQQGPTWVAGHIGSNALSFDGIDDYVRVADHANLDFTANQDFTVQFWVKTTQGTTASVNPRIIGKQDGGTVGWNISLHEGTTDAKWFGRIVTGGTGIPPTPLDGCTNIATAPLGDTWVHLAFKRQNTTLSTYENGMLCNTYTNASVASADLSSTVALDMGARSDQTQPFAGSLDDIQIYNYARSDTQIAADASPGTTLALTNYRLHSVDRAVGNWVAAEKRSREVRGNGSVGWRFQIHNTGASSATTTIGLQCKIGASSYEISPEYLVDQEGALNTDCSTKKYCVQADTVLAAGDDGTSAPELTAPGGSTYAGGTVVTSTTWPTITLDADEVAEVQFRTATVAIPDNLSLCCRPSKGDGTPLDEYNVGTIGEACVTAIAGSTSIF